MAKICMKLHIKFDPRWNKAFKKMGKFMIKVNSGIQAFAESVKKIPGLLYTGYKGEEMDKECAGTDLDINPILNIKPGEISWAFNELCKIKEFLFEQPKKMNGQGIVFYFISRWFFPAREKRDFWGNPDNPQAAYYQAWFRGRTAKSMKPPIRFKGWKGGR